MFVVYHPLKMPSFPQRWDATPAGGIGFEDYGDLVNRRENLWTTVFAAACFIRAIAIAGVALLLAAGLVREYGGH
jgi:hypothetical protein